MQGFVEAITGRSGSYIEPNAGRPALSPASPRAPEAGAAKRAPGGVLRFDRKTFFDGFYMTFGKLSRSQVSGIDQLLGFIEQDEKVDDVRAAALILAIVQHETDDAWHPLADFIKRSRSKAHGQKKASVRMPGDTEPGDRVRFRPRGYFGLEGRANYERFGDLLGIDLIADPDAVNEPATAYRILSLSLFQGLLTGKKLGDFPPEDYHKRLTAYRLRPSGKVVAAAAVKFEAILRHSLAAQERAAAEAGGPPAAPKATPERAPAVARKSPARKSRRKAAQKRAVSGRDLIMAPRNRLREIREVEGLTIVRLAALANVTAKTISRWENGSGSIAPATKSSIIRGLNKIPDRLREYTLEDVFPTHSPGRSNPSTAS